MSNDSLPDSVLQLLDEADDLIWNARAAARKIKVERQRGAGYYHAEVDSFLSVWERLDSFRDKKRAATEARADSAVPSSHVSETDGDKGPETVAYLHDRGSDNKLSFSAEPIDGRTSYEIRELVFKDESRESILREALARIEELTLSSNTIYECHRSMAEIREAARSALAGIPMNASPNVSGDQSGALLPAAQRPDGATER